MTMPSSGALNMGGTSSPVSVAQELGLSLTATITMDQANVRALAGVSATSGTTWSMNSLYGKSSGPNLATWTKRFGSTAMTSTIGPIVYLSTTGKYFFGSTYGAIYSSTDLISWTSTTVSPSGFSSVSAAYSNGSSVAVFGCYASGSNIYYTMNGGANWVSVFSLPYTGATVTGIAYSGSAYVFVYDAGRVFATTNFSSFTGGTVGGSSSFNGIYGVAWGGTTFVAVGASGAIYTAAAAGTTWTSRTSGTTSSFSSVAYGSSKFCAVGSGGMIRTSPDGITWTAQTSGSTESLSNITWGGTQFVIRTPTAGRVLTSPDGVTWTTTNTGFNLGSYYYANSTNLYFGTYLYTSASLSSFTFKMSPNDGARMSYSPVIGAFVAIGTSLGLLSSTNGQAWTASTTAPSGYAVSGGGPVMVVFNTSGVPYSSTSLSGTWTAGTNPSGAGAMFDVTYANSQYVAVGSSGHIITSSTGTSWTAQTSGTTLTLYSVAWSPAFSSYVAVGNTGAIFVSPTGVTWTNRTTGTTVLNYVASSSSIAVAVGNSGTILTSTDGITWTARTSGTTQALYTVSWVGTGFVAGGNGGVILTSTDGITWTTVASGSTSYLFDASAGFGSTALIGGGTSSNGFLVFSTP